MDNILLVILGLTIGQFVITLPIVAYKIANDIYTNKFKRAVYEDKIQRLTFEKNMLDSQNKSLQCNLYQLQKEIQNGKNGK